MTSQAGLRHNLPQINVMDDQARINANGGPYTGLDRYEAREKILADLEELGLLVGVKDHTLCHRQMRPLQDHRRASAFHSVVHQDSATGRSRH